MIAEHEATARFAAYAVRLEAQGAPSLFLAEMRKASADEARHLEICLSVARRYGAGPIELPDEDFSVRGADDGERLLADVVASCCFSETLNVSLLAASVKAASDREIQEATRALLADEVDHSRLGWAYLAWARGLGQGERLGDRLPRMLASVTLPLLFAETPPLPDEARLLDFGDLPLRTRRELFFETVREVILPGLAAHGTPTEGAQRWLDHPSWA
ncbi:MAG: hypothetical protein ACYDCL_19575 [Myxococcales bacterium]